MLTAQWVNQYALPAFLLAILIEAFGSFFYQKSWYQPRDTVLSLGLLVLSGLIDVLPKALAVVVFYHLYELSPLKTVIGTQWWAWGCSSFWMILSITGFIARTTRCAYFGQATKRTTQPN